MRSEPGGPESLAGRRIRPGERWILSAGFNVDPALRDTTRIDCERDDLARLADAGARVAVLSHQGSHADGTAGGLDHVAGHLSRTLGRPVEHHPESASDAARDRAAALRDGEIVLFGNTRLHAGEEAGDPELARRFARLGDAVAVGGFSKAHRAHASNVGVLRFRPGVATEGLVREVRALRPWAGRTPGRRSVAVLGGLKAEKTLVGLRRLGAVYDVVVPGGAVLTAVLGALGHPIGRSVRGQRHDACVRAAAAALADERVTVCLPEAVVVVDPLGRTRTVAVDAVPDNGAIVDLVPGPAVGRVLDELAADGGRAVLAGTPARYTDGHRAGTDAVLAAFAAPGVDALLLGGDTVAELPWSGPVSSGGGSALHYLADGTCAVLDALAVARTPEVVTG